VKSYHFRLANVERIRALEERVARQRMMVTLCDLLDSQLAEREAQNALSSWSLPAESLTTAEVQWFGDQSERLAQYLARRRLQVVTNTAAYAAARRAWSESTKRVGVLESLDEKSLELWHYEERRREIAELDDLTTYRYQSKAGTT
jgi:flagellar export protein FliJ